MIIALVLLVNANENNLHSDRDSPRAIEAARPVGAVDALDAHPGARSGRVDEPPVAKIYADVGIRPIERIEENEVTCLDLRAADGVPCAALIPRIAGEADPVGFDEDVCDKAAAIESGCGRLTAKPVVHAEREQGLEQRLRTAGMLSGCRRCRRYGWNRLRLAYRRCNRRRRLGWPGHGRRTRGKQRAARYGINKNQ